MEWCFFAHRLCAEFLRALKGVRTKSGWKLLIVDDESMRDISACLGMYDIMEQGDGAGFFLCAGL